jgi:hypothetical protein
MDPTSRSKTFTESKTSLVSAIIGFLLHINHAWNHNILNFKRNSSDRDIKTFKKYEDLFTVNKHPSGRTFTDKTSARIPAESEFLKKEFMGKKSDLFSS